MLLTGSPPSRTAAGPGLVGGAPRGREGVDATRLALQPLVPALLRAACGNVGGTAGTSCVFKDLPCQLWTRDAPHLCPGFLSQPYASSVASFRFNIIVLFNVSLLSQGSKGSSLGHHLVAESSAVGGRPPWVVRGYPSSEKHGQGLPPPRCHTHTYTVPLTTSHHQ